MEQNTGFRELNMQGHNLSLAQVSMFNIKNILFDCLHPRFTRCEGEEQVFSGQALVAVLHKGMDLWGFLPKPRDLLYCVNI